MNHSDRQALSEYREARSPSSLAECLQEALAIYIPQQHRDDAFAAIEEALTEAPAKSNGGANVMDVFGVLETIYGDTRFPLDIRRIALAASIGSNNTFFGRSYQHYADWLGVTRACIQADAREPQKKFGLRSRRDKSDDAREISRMVRKQRREERSNAGALSRLLQNL